MAGERAGLQSRSSSASGHLAALLPQQRRGADPGRGRQRAGTRGALLQNPDLGLACSRERQLGYVEQFKGGGWQTYCTRTETAVQHRGWKGSCWSSSSLRAPSDTRGRSGSPQPCPPPARVSAGRTPPPTPLADGRPPASAHPSQKLHKFKQGSEGGDKKRRKTNQDHFRAVQIGGSAGCRRNQLMQLCWRPAVDHLPGSRVAVVAVSAGLAPRRAGPRGRREPSARPRAVGAALRGGGPGASPSQRARTRGAQPGRLRGRNGQLPCVFCRGFARLPCHHTNRLCLWSIFVPACV